MSESASKPLVSIVMPVKNTEQYIEACLDSIISQNYKNWELIAVDDHSDDHCLAILNKCATIDHRIKVFKNKGQGIIPALQTAYRQSSGSYITRMDSDDLMPSQKIGMLTGLLNQFGKGHVSTGLVRYFSDEQLMDGYQKYQDWLNNLARTGKQFQEIYKECVIPSPCWMMNKCDFDAIGAFSSEHYPEDYDLCFRMRKHGIKPISSDEVLHLWRDYPSRTSRIDEHYSDNRFLDLKIHHYLDFEYDSERPLILWGAGKKAKKIAKLLDNQSIMFQWLCNNEQKIGHNIYGHTILSSDKLSTFSNPQIIIAVAGKLAQKEIKFRLSTLKFSPISNYYFFC